MELIHKDLTDRIIGSAIEVHRTLGPGLLESVYESCLAYELENADLRVQRQLSLPVQYKDKRLDVGFRLDLVVEGRVIVELKAIDELQPVHEAQLLTYLRLTGIPVGLLMNFNVRRLRDGIVRRALTRT